MNSSGIATAGTKKRCAICLSMIGYGQKRSAVALSCCQTQVRLWRLENGIFGAVGIRGVVRRLFGPTEKQAESALWSAFASEVDAVKRAEKATCWSLGELRRDVMACVWKRAAKRRHERFKNDPVYKITRSARHRIWKTIKRAGGDKSDSTFRLAGCTDNQLLRHLESLFEDGMSFDNYGTAWEVDHIMPCSSFDLSIRQHQRMCFHWTNLRPMWKAENRRKSATIPFGEQALLPLGHYEVAADDDNRPPTAKEFITS